ncbi:PREDICTED: UPF0678 fatty acid-binding protein-like protein MSMEG_6574/MSMEI_6396 [Habropoda laboriosa]|nr:PREDICTED: UPF0678 fatty acid-binding protein-like protein MSMEG_6574/MSMEI_6396 [Habropoda laboriosa]
MKKLPMHAALKPLAWIKGIWKTKNPGVGKYPTIKSFQYCERTTFGSIGQPMLTYSARSWYADTKDPIHYEVGFLKIMPDTNRVQMLLSHNRGFTTIEEGVFENKIIKLKTIYIGKPTEGTRPPAITELRRQFELVGDCLQHTLCMATENTPEVQEHLLATYVRECN